MPLVGKRSFPAAWTLGLLRTHHWNCQPTGPGFPADQLAPRQRRQRACRSRNASCFGAQGRDQDNPKIVFCLDAVWVFCHHFNETLICKHPIRQIRSVTVEAWGLWIIGKHVLCDSCCFHFGGPEVLSKHICWFCKSAFFLKTWMGLTNENSFDLLYIQYTTTCIVIHDKEYLAQN